MAGHATQAEHVIAAAPHNKSIELACYLLAALRRNRMARNSPAPRIGRLAIAAIIRVGESIVGWHIHHDERVKHHLKAAPVQVTNGFDHAVV